MKQLRMDYPEGYDHKFTVIVFEDMTEKNKKEKLTKILKIIESIKGIEVGNIQFSFSFYEERLLKEKGTDIYVSADYLDYLLYSVRLTGDEISNINTVEDLEKELKNHNKK